MTNETTLHLQTWAADMKRDVDAARSHIAISAISIQPPRTKSPGDWPRLWRALCDAAARGVHVQMYLPAPQNPHPATRFNQHAAEDAIKAGIHCKLVRGPRLLHCKSLTLDATIVWLGSGNFTAAAAHHNIEAYTRSVRPDFAAEVLARWERLP